MVEDIWESIEVQPEDHPLTEWQKAELDRRLEDINRNPENEIAWEVLRDSVLGKL